MISGCKIYNPSWILIPCVDSEIWIQYGYGSHQILVSAVQEIKGISTSRHIMRRGYIIQYSAILIKNIYKEICKEETDNLFFVGNNHGERRSIDWIN